MLCLEKLIAILCSPNHPVAAHLVIPEGSVVSWVLPWLHPGNLSWNIPEKYVLELDLLKLFVYHMLKIQVWMGICEGPWLFCCECVGMPSTQITFWELNEKQAKWIALKDFQGSVAKPNNSHIYYCDLSRTTC